MSHGAVGAEKVPLNQIAPNRPDMGYYSHKGLRKMTMPLRLVRA